MGEESVLVSYAVKSQKWTPSLPLIVMPEALGVAPPSLSSAPAFASPEPEATAGEERKKSGDCVEVL
jgi:hypothetical protein